MTPVQLAKSTLPKVIRVFLVDDHPLVRDGMRLRIDRQEDMEVCGEAADCSGALMEILHLAPDVAVVDLTLGVGSGLDLIKRLASRKGAPAILVSSMHDELIYAERALQAGALGYVGKQADSSLVVNGIRTVHQGQWYVSEPVQQRLIGYATGNAKSGSPVERLTDRELEVFTLLGRGYTVRDIGEGLKLSVKTVETYRDRIRNKLQIKSGAQLLRFAVNWVRDHGGDA